MAAASRALGRASVDAIKVLHKALIEDAQDDDTAPFRPAIAAA